MSFITRGVTAALALVAGAATSAPVEAHESDVAALVATVDPQATTAALTASDTTLSALVNDTPLLTPGQCWREVAENGSYTGPFLWIHAADPQSQEVVVRVGSDPHTGRGIYEPMQRSFFDGERIVLFSTGVGPVLPHLPLL